MVPIGSGRPTKRMATPVKVALITTTGLVLVGLTPIAVAEIQARPSSPAPAPDGQPVVSTPASSPVVPTPVVTTPPPCGGKKIQITSPKDETAVTGRKGVLVKFAACNLDKGFTGWLFDYDPEDQTYYMSEPEPVTGNGTFAVTDAPIGDPGDDRKVYKLAVVLADPACTTLLRQLQPDANDNYPLTKSQFPRGSTFD